MTMVAQVDKYDLISTVHDKVQWRIPHKHSNRSLGSIRGEEFIGNQGNYQILEKDPAEWKNEL